VTIEPFPRHRRKGVWPQDLPYDCQLDADGGWIIVSEMPDSYRMGASFKTGLLDGARMEKTDTVEDFLART
jgi:hypothetical protein